MEKACAREGNTYNDTSAYLHGTHGVLVVHGERVGARAAKLQNDVVIWQGVRGKEGVSRATHGRSGG